VIYNQLRADILIIDKKALPEERKALLSLERQELQEKKKGWSG